MRGILRHPIVNVEIFTSSSGRLERVVLHLPGSRIPEESCDARITSILAALRSLLDEASATEFIDIDLSSFTPFQQSVLTAARQIPRGSTVTYTELAKMAGHPTAVRAVASVMRNNHFPLIIPCHRVVRSDGGIGGFLGRQAGPEIDIKRRLLESEDGLGVGKRRVAHKRTRKSTKGRAKSFPGLSVMNQ